MTEFKAGEIYDIRAKPKSSKSEIIIEENQIIVYLKSIPDENKANDELVKLFKKQLKLKVELIGGFKSKNKRIKIIS